jgi:hypothetical protein
MNAPARPVVGVDPLAVFETQCARWATAYAEGRATLQRVADLLEALAPLDMSAADAQRIIADAITAATASAVDPGDDDDDYAGLTGSFARLCRAADAEAEKQHRSRAKLVPHVAASTLDAARFLIQQNDPARLKAWLLAHGKRERAAICAGLNNNNPEKGDNHEQENGNAQDETSAAHASGDR